MKSDIELKKLGQAIFRAIKDKHSIMMTTVTEDGRIHSRPMYTPEFKVEEFDGSLWFFSNRNSLKNQEILDNDKVNLAYANPVAGHFISLSGRATISGDKDKLIELWQPTLHSWFPDGLETPGLSLIRVDIESAEIWETATGNSTHIRNLSDKLPERNIGETLHGEQPRLHTGY